MSDIVQKLQNEDSIWVELDLMKKAALEIQKLQNRISELETINSDILQSIPKLIEGARRPLLDQIDKLNKGIIDE